MTPENFCYFVQGYFEITKAVTGKLEVDPIVIKVIDDHLQLVFKKETPKYTQLGEVPQTSTTTLPFKVPNLTSTPFDLSKYDPSKPQMTC